VRRRRLALLCLLAAASTGQDCGGGGGSGAAAQNEFDVDLAGCAALSSQFPPGFDFTPGDPSRVLVADFAPPTVIGFDVSGGRRGVPPEEADRPIRTPADPVYVVPPDSDGDGVAEAIEPIPFSVVLDDVLADDPVLAAADLAIATSSGYEALLFLRADGSAARELEVAVDASFAPGDRPFLPAPGSRALRRGLSTLACVRPPPGARDSRGAPLATVLSPAASCDPDVLAYFARFGAGVARAAGRLFVATSNLGAAAGSADPQFLPGTVLVHDLDTSVEPPVVGPSPDAPAIFTTAFNPTHVTSHATATRDFVLVSLSGSLGIEPDDPDTTPIETGGIALTDSAIDVIDAHTLELVATYPLGPAAIAFGPLAIDPSGRVAVAGSSVGRALVAVDLSVLDALPAAPPGGVPLVLDGSTGPDGVIFDAAAPLVLPARTGGAPAVRPAYSPSLFSSSSMSRTSASWRGS